MCDVFFSFRKTSFYSLSFETLNIKLDIFRRDLKKRLVLDTHFRRGRSIRKREREREKERRRVRPKHRREDIDEGFPKVVVVVVDVSRRHDEMQNRTFVRRFRVVVPVCHRERSPMRRRAEAQRRLAVDRVGALSSAWHRSVGEFGAAVGIRVGD